MQVLVNGNATEVEPDTTVTGVLARLGYQPGAAGIAVALNGEVVPRPAWDTTVLGERDAVEVLGARQGG